MQRVALGAPFVVAGMLKVVYDLALYATFRRVPLPEESEAATTPDYPSTSAGR
jgi:hypothetical protein